MSAAAAAAGPQARTGPVMCIVGARPNFMAMAPILRAFAARQPSDLALLAEVAVLPPQGDRGTIDLRRGATRVLTDSGGLQEETTALGVPCLTLRENTERPITVEQGTNTMVGRDADAIRTAVAEILAGRGKRGRVPEHWDGHAARRIAADLNAWLAAGAPAEFASG